MLWECASIKVPPGGPVDETPPEIVSISPSNKTVNLSERRIVVEFSEYMDASSFDKNITVYPRLNSPIKHKFRGDKIIINLPEQLDSTTTYIIQLNRNIKDEHGVPLAKSEQIAFSLGDQIDIGRIEGQIFGSGKAAVHLWKISDVNSDSMFNSIPDYITDVEDNGEYSFDYLAPSRYMILAVDKSGSNLPLNVERSEYGLYWQNSIVLTDNDTITGVSMRMWKEPQELKLVRGEWSNFSWGNIFFNNNLPDSIELNMFLKQGEEEVNYKYFINSFDRTNVTIYPSDSLKTETLKILFDSIRFENQILLDSTYLEIRIPQEIDTTYLQLIKPQSRLTIIPNGIEGDQVDLVFSKPVTLSSDPQFQPKLFNKDSNEVIIKLTKIDPMYYRIDNSDEWLENHQYHLILDREGMITKFGRGLQDSLITINISSTNRMGFGGVTGALDRQQKDRMMIELYSVKNPSWYRLADVNSQSQFEFDMIPEGEYSLRIFDDNNDDMMYNFGSAYPFHPSEWFYFYPDTFEVRANWDTELNPILLPEVK
jgi:hypothetical protein